VLCIAIAAALLGGLAQPSPAHASVRTFKPVRARAGVVVYRLSTLRGTTVARAHLRRSRRRRPLSSRRIRVAVRRGYLRVRLSRRARHSRRARSAQARVKAARRLRRWRLVVVTKPRRTPASGSGCPSFGQLKVGNWPGSCWRPYSDQSPFNRPLPASPKLAAGSTAIVGRVLGFGQPDNLVAGDADSEWDYSHPTYYAQPTDPVFKLHCYESSWGTCAIEGHEIRIPDAARAAAGGDGHLTVVDQASGWEYDLYKVRSKPRGGGTLEFRWGGRTRIDGTGLGSAATAAGYGNLAGIIRAQEMQAGEIRHALFMVVDCDAGVSVYPAKGTGRACSDRGLSSSGAPPMGARFQLAMSDSQIDALSVPAWKKTILRAMAHYGMYVGDTGGGGWGIQMESGSTYTSFGYEDAMVAFARQAGVPTYNGKHVFNLRDGVDWAKYLRVVDPCEAQASC
jgi:hypothetical protein